MSHQFGRVQVVPPGQDQSLGELVATATKDLSTLIRMEKELAKAELQQAARGTVPVLLGGIMAAVVGLPAMLMFSVWAALGLGTWIGTMWGFFVMFWFWALVGAIGALVAMRSVRRVQPKPERTIQTIKDTAEWARHPTVAPTVTVDTLGQS